MLHGVTQPTLIQSCFCRRLLTWTLVRIDTTQAVIQGDSSTADEGTAVTFHYLYEASTGNYTQEVIVGGSIVSTVSTSDGDAQGWGSAVECAAEDCGTVPAHTWTNVSIILSEADSTYQNTLALGTGVSATMTSDDDITFTVGTIEIPSWDFTTESVVEGSSTTSSSSSAASSGVSSSYTSPDTASASGSASSGSYGSGSSSSSSGSQGAQPSGTSTSGGSGSSSGSGSWGADGAQPTGGFGGGYGGSSTGSSSGAKPSGGFGGFGGSSTGSSDGAQSSGTSSGWGSWGNSNAAWRRSRISRHQAGN